MFAEASGPTTTFLSTRKMDNGQVTLLGTRRAQECTNGITWLKARIPIHEALQILKQTTDEISAQMAFVELPPIAHLAYERKVLDMVKMLFYNGKHIILLVQPSLRKKTQRSIWVQRWNNIDTPFKFRQTCCCKLTPRKTTCHFVTTLPTHERHDTNHVARYQRSARRDK